MPPPSFSFSSSSSFSSFLAVLVESASLRGNRCERRPRRYPLLTSSESITSTMGDDDGED